jgi:hypothetical protein
MTSARRLSSLVVIMLGPSLSALASPVSGPVPAEPSLEPEARPQEHGNDERERVLHHRVNAGVGPLLYLPPLGPTISGWALEASYGVRRSDLAVEAEAGIRGIFGESVAGTIALDFFAGIALAPEMGSTWAPRIGVEIGASTAARSILDEVPPESYARTLAAASPGYVGTALSPARFRWRQWHVDAMAIFMGTSLPELGRAARLQVNFLRLGASF